MAGAYRQSPADLIETLLEHGPSFEFFQAVALAQRLFPDAAPIGRQGPPARERVRLRPRLSLGFDASDIGKVVTRGDEEAGEPVVVEFETTFLGLYGTASPLPTHYTEDLLAYHVDGKYDPVREFLDLFHHRLLSLFFRVGYKYRFDLAYTADEPADSVAVQVATLVGNHVAAIPAPTRRVGLAAPLLRGNGSAAAVETLLHEAFPEACVAVEPCVARWLSVERSQRNALGRSRLGVSLTLGAHVLDRACTFGIRLGPLDAEAFEAFLPGGDKLVQLLDLVRFANPQGLDIELDIRVQPDAVSPVQLGGSSARLGWSSWIGEHPSQPLEVRFFYVGGDDERR